MIAIYLVDQGWVILSKAEYKLAMNLSYPSITGDGKFVWPAFRIRMSIAISIYWFDTLGM